jgi:hypothetical protein
MSSQAYAQSPDAVTNFYQPAARPVAYNSSLLAGCAEEAPTCEAAVPGCGEAGCGAAGCCEAGCGAPGSSCCGNGCGSCNRGCNGPLASIFKCCTADPWTLKGSSGFNYGGWTQIGWQDRADGAFTGNGPFVSQHENGNVNLNQLYAFVEKVADGSCGLDWGMRFDSFYGVDGNEGQSFGNIIPGHWDYLNGFGGVGDPSPHGAYEIALPQAYAQVAYGKLSTKIGHFYTPIGYEVVTSPSQFFLSRQMTFYNSEPFTHTGLYSTYTASDKFNFSAGWVYGMDTGFYQYHNGGAFLGGFTWIASDFLTFNYYMIGGNLGWRGQGAINSWIASLQWTKRFQTVHQFDVLASNVTNDVSIGPGNAAVPSSFQTSGIARDSTGFINYAFYQLTDCVKLGSRLEWYKADGVSYQTYTNGVNVKFGPNLTFRPEARYMWSNDKTSLPGANLFNTGHRMVLGCDMIYTF